MPVYITKTIGVGRTPEFSLRVSAGVLNRVEIPGGLIVLERLAKAEINENGVLTKKILLQPFGGASRLQQPEALLKEISQFHYEDEFSKENQDFRLYIRPADLTKVVRFTEYHFENKDTGVIRLNAKHELFEEFLECYGTYHRSRSSLETLISEVSAALELNAVQIKTGIKFKTYSKKNNDFLMSLREKNPEVISRIFNHVHQVEISNPFIIQKISEAAEYVSDENLLKQVVDKSRWRRNHGEKPRAFASGFFITSLQKLREHYRSTIDKPKGLAVLYENYRISENVYQLLEP